MDDIGKVTEYPVEISNGEALFRTEHFSIYTLAEFTEKESTEEGLTKEEQINNQVNNPKTGDNIVTYIVIGVVAYFSTSNREISKRQQVLAQQETCKANFTKMFTTIIT